jgi:hypothetical protein
MAHAAPADAGAFALQLAPCLDVSGYTGLSFHTQGSLGTCPLRAAALFRDRAAATADATCPLDDCRPGTSVAASAGLTTVPLAPVGAEAPAALVGLAWRFDLPGDGSRICDADFTLDDLRLVAAPP